MKSLLFLIGCLCLVGAVAAGLYVGFYLCLYCGIVLIVKSAVATPVVASGIAWGVVRVLCTGLAGWVTFFIGTAISGLFFGAASSSGRRRY